MDPKTLLSKAAANKATTDTKASTPENKVEVADTTKAVVKPATTKTPTVVKSNTTASKVLPVTVCNKDCNNKNDNVARFNGYVNAWENLCKNGKYVDAIVPFRNMIEFILNNQDDRTLLDAWRMLFVKYRTTYLSTEHALAGFTKISSEDVKNKISIAYMLMYELVNPKRYRKVYDFDFASKTLSNPKCKVPNGYVAYIVERMR